MPAIAAYNMDISSTLKKKKRKRKYLLLISCHSLHFYSQNIITWNYLKMLSLTKFGQKNSVYMVPKFSSSVKAMDNKEVQIRGFIIPVDIVQDYYVLSANPYSSCFLWTSWS